MAPAYLGLIGIPLKQSKAPLIHEQFAKQKNIQLNYKLIETEPENFEDTFLKFSKNGGCGLNITSPYKTEVMKYVTEVTPRALIAGSSNTIKFNSSNKIIADNTDGAGLIHDITKNLGWHLKRKSILILGAGGAARGILAPLFSEQVSKITVVNRNIEKAIKIHNEFKTYGELEIIKYNELSLDTFDIIINATSASLHNELPPLPKLFFNKNIYCYEMAYGIKHSPFLHWAHQNGAHTLSDGTGMAVEQAAEAFKLWFGTSPETKPVINFLKKLKAA